MRHAFWQLLALSTTALLAWAGPLAAQVDTSPPGVEENQVGSSTTVTLLPGQCLIKMKAAHSLWAATTGKTDLTGLQHGTILNSIAEATGFRLQLMQTKHFGWSLYAITAADGAPVRGEAATRAAVQQLRQHPAVAAVAVNHWLRPLAVPNDSRYGDQWALSEIGAEAAWDTTTGEATQRIGVIDTGSRRDHQDLQDKDLTGYDFISDQSAAADGDGRDSDYSDPGDDHNCVDGLVGHGTHVAATILASSNNSVGIAGINWQAKLVTARAMTACGGTGSDTLDAIAWLAGYTVADVPDLEQPVAVINLSLGVEESCSSTLQEYIDTIHQQRQVVFVASTGNDGNAAAVRSPANCNTVVAVAAHGPGSDRPLASYANTTGRVDIVAPGGDITSAAQNGILSACSEATDCYQTAQGTSMAAPHVTGAISLMLALKPNLSHDQIISILQTTGGTCTDCGGAVSLQLDTALNLTSTTETTVPPDPTEVCPGDPCTPVSGTCGSGHACVLINETVPCCLLTCDNANGLADCPQGSRCVDAGTTGVCQPGGDREEGAACEDDEKSCRGDTVCGNYNDEKLCLKLCDDSRPCEHDDQSCDSVGSYSVCLPPHSKDQDDPYACDCSSTSSTAALPAFLFAMVMLMLRRR